MRISTTLLMLLSLPLTAGEFALSIVDDTQRPLAAVAVDVLFSRLNDPREASLRSFEGLTDAHGVFHCKTTPEMILIRIHAQKAGHFKADADRRHGLGVVPSPPQHTLTLPRLVPGTPLCYKAVRLSAEDKQLPPQTWIGFDLALGEAVAPWGNGDISDIFIWNEGAQNGWSQSAATIAQLRKAPYFARLEETEFAALHGRFQGVTRLRAGTSGAGLQRTTAFWPYCELKLPAEAPTENYLTELAFPYGAMPPADAQPGDMGLFLRVRPRLDADGRVLSAHYAKIQGPVTSTLGRMEFRYYFNPVRDDRRLVHDQVTNLLRPPAGTDPQELERYQPFER